MKAFFIAGHKDITLDNRVMSSSQSQFSMRASTNLQNDPPARPSPTSGAPSALRLFE